MKNNQYTRKDILDILLKKYNKKVTGVHISNLIKQIGIEELDYVKIHSKLTMVTEGGLRKLLEYFKLQN